MTREGILMKALQHRRKASPAALIGAVVGAALLAVGVAATAVATLRRRGGRPMIDEMPGGDTGA